MPTLSPALSIAPQGARPVGPPQFAGSAIPCDAKPRTRLGVSSVDRLRSRGAGLRPVMMLIRNRLFVVDDSVQCHIMTS